MAERIFYKKIGASMLSFEPSSNQIVFRTPMYDPKELRTQMREVTITEEEWAAIIKYGEDAGFCKDIRRL